MIEEQQLQLGELERLDDAMVEAQAQRAPAAEEQGETEYEPPVLPVESSDSLISPLSEGVNLFPVGADTYVPPSVPQLEAAADVYTLAGAGMNRPPITAADVDAALHSGAPQSAVQALVAGIREEDLEVEQMATLELLGDPTTAIQERLEAVKRLKEDNTFDANLVERAALHNLAVASYMADDTEESEYAYEAAADYAESIPKDVQLVAHPQFSDEEYRQAFDALLDVYATEANESLGWNVGTAADFTTAALVPFRFQAPVVAIYNAIMPPDLPLATDARGTILMGEGLAAMRAYLKDAPPQKKLEALQTMMRILKPNSGIFAEGNDMVTLHVLQQVFTQLDQRQPGVPSIGALAAGTTAAISGGPLAAPVALGALARTTDPVNFDQKANRLVDNVGSLLDLAFVGALAKATLKAGMKVLPKSLARAQRVDPALVNKVMTDAIADPELRARLGGMSTEDIMQTFFPSASNAAREGGVNGLQELLARNLDIREAALRVSSTSNLTAAERAQAAKEFTAELGEIAARPSSTLHLDKTVLADRNGTDLEITAVFGRDKDKGWSQLGNARKAAKDEAKELFGSDVETVVVARHPKTGELVEVGKGVPDKQIGEFYVQAKDVRSYEAAPTTFHELQFAPNTLFNAPVGRWLNKLSLGFANPTNIFGRQVTDAMSHAKGLQTRWQTLTLDLTKDINSLSAKQQAALSKTLKQGERARTATGRGKTYTIRELQRKGLDEPAIRAYYQTRMMSDIMYDVANRQTRTAYMRQGIKDIQGPQGRVGLAKPLRQQDALGDIKGQRADLSVYDPTTQTFTRLSRDDIAATYEMGGSLARLTTPIVTKRGEALHVLVDPKAGTKVQEIPRQVMTKIEGYYPHVWEGNFVVYGRTAEGNKVALGLATNEVDAANAARRRQAALNNRKAKGKKEARWVEFSYELDRSLQDLGHRGMMAEDMYTNLGGLVYGQRNGGRLANFSKADGDILVDPVESFLRGMEVVGYSTTKTELANNLTQRLANFIRTEGLQLKDPRALPDPVTNPLVPSQAKADAYRRAQAAMEQIEFYRRTPDAVDQTLSSWFLGASSMFQKLYDGPLPGKALYHWASKKAAAGASRPPRPDSALRGFMHRYAIAAAPYRHLALGITQSLVTFGLSPKAYAQAVSQAAPVTNLLFHEALRLAGKGFVRGKDVDKLYRNAAKLTPGMDEKELRTFVRMLFDSGITSSTAHHNQMRDSMRSLAMDRMRQRGSKAGRTVTEKLAGAGRAADDAVFGNMSRIGFELGENINRVVTALVQYGRDKAAGIAKLDDPDYVRGLVGKVNELTGNMTAEMGYQFQRGWFKNFTQFWGFQLKMMHLMLPAAMGGSRTLSSAERWRVALGQFLLFGRRGGAHMDAIYRFMDMKMAEKEAEDPESRLVEAWRHPVTQAGFEGYVFDWTLNKAIKMAAGPDSPDYALNDAFAPGGGTQFVLDAITDMASEPDFLSLTGLSGQKASKLVQYMEKVAGVTLAQVQDLDYVPLNERAEELAREGAGQLFSQYDRILAARAAEKMDGWVSSGGYITEGYSGALEGVLFSHFGIMTKDRAKLYEDMDTLMVGHAKEPEKALDKLADQYYRNFITYASRLDTETTGRDDVFSNMLDKWTRQQGLLFSMLEPYEAEYVQDKVRARITRLLKSPESAEKRFVERITKDVREGHYGDTGPGALVYLQNAPYVKDNPALVETIDRAFIEATSEE